MPTTSDKQLQVDTNYLAFEKLLPDLAKNHPGKFALMHDGGVIEVFDTARDANAAGSKIYPDGLFSVQLIDETPADLGFFSHALAVG